MLWLDTFKRPSLCGSGANQRCVHGLPEDDHNKGGQVKLVKSWYGTVLLYTEDGKSQSHHAMGFNASFERLSQAFDSRPFCFNFLFLGLRA